MSRKPTVPPPTKEKVAELARQAGFQCTEEDIQDYRDLIEHALADYTRVFDLPEPKLPVKYPRDLDSIYKPRPEDNPCNAWSMRVSLKGAEQGKLSGKTVAIKDNVQIAGVPMTNGSELIRGFVPTEDATIITRILDAGGHITGTTNTTDMCVSGASAYGANGPVTNPHDDTRSTGGSSAGSGALLALGEVDLAIGCDQGGSIRIPSSWCGCVGLKPTHGLVPYTGVVPIEPSMDHIGPMAKNVTDCALFLEVLAGYDGLDSRQRCDVKVPKYSELLDKDLSGKKIGFVTEGFLNCESDVSDIVKESFKHFRGTGIEVEEVSIPWHSEGKALWGPIITEGCVQTMLDDRGALYGLKGYKCSALVDHLHNTVQTKADYLAKPMKFMWMAAKYIRETCGPAYYARASNLLRYLEKAYDDVLEKYDVLLMPTLPYVAPKLPTKELKPSETASLCFGMVQNTSPFNFTGHPALSINAGFTEGKLPVGLMIVGKHYDEATILSYAYAFEKARDSVN